jgi:hypothetical protein
MNNDTKDLLMQYLYRIGEHFGIENGVGVSFRRRGELLAKLKEADEDAWTVISNLIEAFIKEDRITNDKEKFDQARLLWQGEHAAAEKEKVEAEMMLIHFCRERGIPVGRVNHAL